MTLTAWEQLNLDWVEDSAQLEAMLGYRVEYVRFSSSTVVNLNGSNTSFNNMNLYPRAIFELCRHNVQQGSFRISQPEDYLNIGIYQRDLTEQTGYTTYIEAEFRGDRYRMAREPMISERKFFEANRDIPLTPENLFSFRWAVWNTNRSVQSTNLGQYFWMEKYTSSNTVKLFNNSKFSQPYALLWSREPRAVNLTNYCQTVSGFEAKMYPCSLYYNSLPTTTNTDLIVDANYGPIVNGPQPYPFNWLEYSAQYKDLWDVFKGNPTAYDLHWKLHGFKEGRDIARFFYYTRWYYLAGYPDLIQEYLANNNFNAAWHKVFYGYDEGRHDNRFDWVKYYQNNPDLRAVFGTNRRDLCRHFVQYGFREGRAHSFVS